MIDEDTGYPPLPSTWSSPPSRPPATPPDEISTAAPVFVTIDFDVGRSPHHWPYWPEPWKRGFQAFPDEGLTLGISGVGGIGAATFILSLEPGTRVIHAWSTMILSTYSGQEQRESPVGQPKRSFEGTAFLLDAGSRDARSVLMRSAAPGNTFLLALPHEEETITVDSPANVITVTSTANLDWALPGQRVVIVAPDMTSVAAVVQAITSTTIQVRLTDATGMITTATLGTAGRAGGRIMPVLQVLLEPQQGFARYATTVDTWSIRARAVVFGWVGTDVMGLGATITTFTDGPTALASITDDDLLIWDRQNAIDGTATESMLNGAELVDLGALPFALGGADVPDWGRSVKYRSTLASDWQWFKAFIRQLRGRQRAFLLSTNRPDLVYVSTVSGGIKVSSASVSGAGDYTAWFASSAHQRLALTINGVVSYFAVTGVTDNGDGTLTLALDLGVSGTVQKVSFLEQVRFERDEIAASWDGWTFSIDETVRVVQDAIDVQSRFVFDKVVTQQFSYTGIPPDTPPAFQEFALPAGGKTYLFNFTSDRSLTFSGAQMNGGNVDGTVLCIENNNTAAFSAILTNEDTNSTTTHRFRNSGLGTLTGAGRSTWYRYNAAVSGGRWIQIL